MPAIRRQGRRWGREHGSLLQGGVGARARAIVRP